LISIPGYAEFTYNADSLLVCMTFSNGTETSYQYDNCHRPTTIQAVKNDTDLLAMNYQYDPVGNITQLDYHRRLPDQQWAESTETFSYDWLDRLILAQGDYGSLSYTYDPVGNRLSQNGVTYTYNNMNELLSISNGTVFTYDEMGNTVTKTDGVTNWSYIYDKRNLLEQVVEDQQVVGEYGYDGTGKRIKKTEWIESLQEYQTIIYIYSGLNVVYEKNPDTGQEATYVYGPSGRIAKKVSGLTDYYHTDHLGSTRLITDESGAVTGEVQYTPFGEPLTEQEEPYLFSGKEKDTSTGLYYFGARYYDSETGRFMTRDPLAGALVSPQTLNRYVYCGNNPLKYVDPLGLWFEKDIDEPEEPDTEDKEENEPKVIELPDGSVLTMDVSGESGNVLVGYGYITNPSGHPRFQIVLVVILFDDDGNVENMKSWKKDELDMNPSAKEVEILVSDMLNVVGEENAQNLANALDMLKDKTHDLGDQSKGEIIAKGAVAGGITGGIAVPIVGIPFGIGFGIGAGAVTAAFTACESDKWNDLSFFLGELLNSAQIPKPT